VCGQLADCALDMEIAKMNSTAVKDQLYQLEAAEQSADAGPACTTAAHGETEFFDLTDEQFQEQYLSGMLNSNFRSIGRSECPQIETELVERQPQQDSISPLMKQQVGQLDEWLGGEVIEKLPDSPTAKRLRARRAKQTSKMRSPPAAASGRRSSPCNSVVCLSGCGCYCTCCCDAGVEEWMSTSYTSIGDSTTKARQ